MAAPRPAPRPRKRLLSAVKAPELEQFVVVDVQLTGEILGAGAYGSVEEVEIPGARVAAKKLHSKLIDLGSDQQVQKWVTDFVKECMLMSQLRHPHIVQFLGVAYLPKSPIPVLLMEKLQTSLDNLLETSPNIPLDVKVHLLTGTAQGMVYLHSRTPPIAHRDLTARNILIDSGLTAKIADLGVARMVSIQPGQLAATMTAGPGNNLYMPPETVQKVGATRYNTAIDIFSFGVVSLFTLTQTFPKDLKPPNFFDETTQRIVGLSEIERRHDYIEQMKAALGETHLLVKLTLDCLGYLPKNRPHALEVLRRLEKVGKTVLQSCTETKLELIQQISNLKKEEKIKQDQTEHLQIVQQLTEKQLANDCLLAEKDKQVEELKEQLTEKQLANDCLLAEKETQVEELKEQLTEKQLANDSLLAEKDKQVEELKEQLTEKQLANDCLLVEKEKQVEELKEQTSIQQKQLDVQKRETERLSKLQTQEEGSQGSRQRTRSVATPKKPQPQPIMVPSSITFDWRRCKDIPTRVDVLDQPVAFSGKLYMRGTGRKNVTVLVYAPENDLWTELPPPPVKDFTVASLRGQLLVVGGSDKSTGMKTNTILTFNPHSQQWIQTYPAIPTAQTLPKVVEYQHHLIVANLDQQTSHKNKIFSVDILDTNSNEWKIAQRFLIPYHVYDTLLIEDAMYLVGLNTQTVVRAHVPTLISGAESGVWESLAGASYYHSSPVTVGNTLLTVGGSDKSHGNPTTSIQMYNPSTKKWAEVGNLPAPMCDSCCTIMNSELFVFHYQSVHVAKLTLSRHKKWQWLRI